MTALTYFAYGSNMSLRRLTERVPSAEPLGPAELPGHALTFRKVSLIDASGKCDIVPSRDASVWGMLFRIEAVEKARLDRVEGVGVGYRDGRVRVMRRGGCARWAHTYFATLTDPSLKPYTWYREHVLRGASEAELPRRYVAAIAAWPAVDDPDPGRTARELSLTR